MTNPIFNPEPGTKAQVPIAVVLKHKIYEFRQKWPKLLCKWIGHKPGEWCEVKSMAWQRQKGIELPKRWASCRRCGKGLEKF